MKFDDNTCQQHKQGERLILTGTPEKMEETKCPFLRLSRATFAALPFAHRKPAPCLLEVGGGGREGDEADDPSVGTRRGARRTNGPAPPAAGWAVVTTAG